MTVYSPKETKNLISGWKPLKYDGVETNKNRKHQTLAMLGNGTSPWTCLCLLVSLFLWLKVLKSSDLKIDVFMYGVIAVLHSGHKQRQGKVCNKWKRQGKSLSKTKSEKALHTIQMCFVSVWGIDEAWLAQFPAFITLQESFIVLLMGSLSLVKNAVSLVKGSLIKFHRYLISCDWRAWLLTFRLCSNSLLVKQCNKIRHVHAAVVAHARLRDVRCHWFNSSVSGSA